MSISVQNAYGSLSVVKHHLFLRCYHIFKRQVHPQWNHLLLSRNVPMKCHWIWGCEWCGAIGIQLIPGPVALSGTKEGDGLVPSPWLNLLTSLWEIRSYTKHYLNSSMCDLRTKAWANFQVWVMWSSWLLLLFGAGERRGAMHMEFRCLSWGKSWRLEKYLLTKH